jgi:hypothetical protein
MRLLLCLLVTLLLLCEVIMYRVHIGYTPKGRDRWKYFETFDQASAFCNEVFIKTRIVLLLQSCNK